MTKLVKTIFGGESDEGIERQEKSNQLLRDFLARQEAMGRADIRKAMPSQYAAMTAGQQSALDVYGQTMPQQANAFVGGNVAAQQSLLSGMPMYEQAIRGGDVNYAALKPYQGSYDMSFAQQKLPDAVANPAYLGEATTIDPVMQHLTPEYQNQQAQMMRMGGVNPLAGMGIDEATLAELQNMGRL
tara:strand:+ start:1187 stop:1744 length:558 start_codon:yes stop_codon:yes gene_type:complete